MTSPAERYSRSKKRQHSNNISVDEFAGKLLFDLDPFQYEAFHYINAGQSVLVAAPTGSGKTVIAQFGIENAIRNNQRIFYTTPIKALTNQKYRDFVDLYGINSVGLMTGDRKLNVDAPILVMTTEILRNMIYDDISRLDNLGWVVMDEVHYLSDKSRGSVWEEVFILLPLHVRFICLSATVGNAEEFGDWLALIRGSMETVLSEKRPIPLEHLVFQNGSILPLYQESKKGLTINPVVISKYNSKNYREKGRSNYRPKMEDRLKLVLELNSLEILPAIYFIFSRAGCDQASKFIFESGVKFTEPYEAMEIEEFVYSHVGAMADTDLAAVDFSQFLSLLKRGIATHHAGMIPIFREIVEYLFQNNLTKLVFATETLSLGINMPAKSVVIESLKKFDGVRNTDITSGEFTQLTGRAGRRGLDEIGYAIVPLNSEIAPLSVSGLASNRTYPLRSNFQPRYNMVLNLIANYGISQSSKLMDKSFAHFQSLQKVEGLIAKSNQINASIENVLNNPNHDEIEIAYDYLKATLELEAQIQSHRMEEYKDNRKSIYSQLAPGAVVYFSYEDLIAIVTDINLSKRNLSILSIENGYQKIGWDRFKSWPEVIGNLKIPKGFNPRDYELSRNLTGRLLEFKKPSKDKSGSKLEELSEDLSNHPFHDLPNKHNVTIQARKLHQFRLELAELTNRVDKHLKKLSIRFEALRNVLSYFDYLDDGGALTGKGHLLVDLYIDRDLLLAESISRDVFRDLDLAEFGSVLSAFIYESRYQMHLEQIVVPTQSVRHVLEVIEGLHDQISNREEMNSINFTTNIDAGLAVAVYDWVNKIPLQIILSESELAPGDFVRWIKQLIDLTNQISNSSAPIALRSLCMQLKDVLGYGIVQDLDYLFDLPQGSDDF